MKRDLARFQCRPQHPDLRALERPYNPSDHVSIFSVIDFEARNNLFDLVEYLPAAANDFERLLKCSD